MEGVCEKVDDPLTGHIEETNRRTDRVTEELNAKTKVLEIDLNRRVENTDSDIQPLTREIIQAKQRTNADVYGKISVCNSQIVAEMQECQTKFLKVSQEIDKLKERLSVNLKGDITNNNNNNNCPVITLANGNQEGTVPVVSTTK
jgi:protein subunit release factor A